MPEVYLPLRSLRILKLSHNDIHSLNQDIFEHIPEITELLLDGNPLKMIDHNTIVAISSLSTLKVNLRVQFTKELFYFHKSNDSIAEIGFERLPIEKFTPILLAFTEIFGMVRHFFKSIPKCARSFRRSTSVEIFRHI